MRKWILAFLTSVIVSVGFVGDLSVSAKVAKISPEVADPIKDGMTHTWKKTSSDFEMIHAKTHEYTVWHNFIKKTRKCDVTYKIRTDVWFCDLHDHTKSAVSLEETIHSEKHS
ncbi:hypothetical protein [Aquibacillus salsiterrae]|uniref:Uncharacterized protein n=1 Tax=Aquibacillus salsiterrae TaxID=2950439 RepID=A0A9X3WBJ0_9BACI|nr:hypothetical protein [Aquibacillus salsiterrae]MDC3416582.1 hypothetical protein [Aquibacillus salsiterrae]